MPIKLGHIFLISKIEFLHNFFSCPLQFSHHPESMKEITERKGGNILCTSASSWYIEIIYILHYAAGVSPKINMKRKLPQLAYVFLGKMKRKCDYEITTGQKMSFPPPSQSKIKIKSLCLELFQIMGGGGGGYNYIAHCMYYTPTRLLRPCSQCTIYF